MNTKIPLTDKQRKWLESLSYSDRKPFPITVRLALENGYYYKKAGQANLRRLVINYKIKHNL